MPKGFRNVGNIRKNVTHTVKDTFIKANLDNSPPDSEKAKILLKLIFTSLALIAVIMLIVSGTDLSPSAIVQGVKDKKVLEKADGNGYPVEIDGNRSISMEHIPNGTAVLTDSNYMVLNDQGQMVTSQAHYMASPVMKTSGRYALLYDKGSMVYSLKTLSGNILSNKTDNSIVTGDLSRTGKFALVTLHDTAFSYISVYSKNGNVMHKWKSGNYYISDIAISPSGSHIAMCGLTTDNGVMKSCIIIQKVGDSKNLKEYTFNDTMMLSVSFTDSDKVMAVGDNLCASLGVNNESQTIFDYEGYIINGFDVSDNGGLALALSQYSDGKNCRITVLNNQGQKVADIATTLISPSVELTSDRINIVSQSHFYSYDFNGKLIKEATVSADCQNTLESGGKNLLRGVTTISCIE